MTDTAGSTLSRLLREHSGDLLNDWIQSQLDQRDRGARGSEQQIREHSQDFLAAFSAEVESGKIAAFEGPDWTRTRDVLNSLSRQRAGQNFTPTETAMFVFSLKRPLFERLRRDLVGEPERLADEMWAVSSLLDRLGLYTMEVFQKSREEIISRQQEEMLELSTPVVQLWRGILALPLIGTLDSMRTQVVMENLLQAIVANEAAIAIIDITGVPTVDTVVAQHLLKTVAAARLMGADCIISGIRPQIAQTIIHLGVDLENVATKATLSDAFRVALRQLGVSIGKAGA